MQVWMGITLLGLWGKACEYLGKYQKCVKPWKYVIQKDNSFKQKEYK